MKICCFRALLRQASHGVHVRPPLFHSRMCVVLTLCKPVSEQLSCSSDSRRPTDVMGVAAIQSPECGYAAARSPALSMSRCGNMGPNQLFMFLADDAVPHPLDVYRLSGGCRISGPGFCYRDGVITSRPDRFRKNRLLKVVRRCSWRQKV